MKVLKFVDLKDWIDGTVNGRLKISQRSWKENGMNDGLGLKFDDE